VPRSNPSSALVRLSVEYSSTFDILNFLGLFIIKVLAGEIINI